MSIHRSKIHDVRPNRLFIEYLGYPREVFATLWNGFRTALLLGVGLTLVLAVLLYRLLQRASAGMSMWPSRKLLLLWPLFCLAVFMQVRSTTGHRPANPALFALTGDWSNSFRIPRRGTRSQKRTVRP